MEKVGGKLHIQPVQNRRLPPIHLKALKEFGKLYLKVNNHFNTRRKTSVNGKIGICQVIVKIGLIYGS